MQFAKMCSLGNDFMLVDAVTQNIFFSPEMVKRLADRHSGIGFDFLLVVEPPYDPELDFHFRVYNAQGNEVTHYGNGIHCFALFVRSKGLTGKRNIKVGTLAGRVNVHVLQDDIASINMGVPDFEPATIPFKATKMEKTYILRAAEKTILGGVVAIRGPHCIVQVDDIKTIDVAFLGALFEKHERFPDHANIGFMQVINNEHIKVRVFERGIGETQASYTGACAAVAIGINQGLLNEKVQVDLTGGSLTISWKKDGQPLMMAGPAIHVFDGFIQL